MGFQSLEGFTTFSVGFVALQQLRRFGRCDEEAAAHGIQAIELLLLSLKRIQMAYKQTSLSKQHK